MKRSRRLKDRLRAERHGRSVEKRRARAFYRMRREAERKSRPAPPWARVLLWTALGIAAGMALRMLVNN